MAKFLFIGATEEMAKYAEIYVQATGRKDVETVWIPSSEMERVIEHTKLSKAQIVITRGFHAAELKRKTDCSVVDIVITAQEMGILIKQAKEIIKKEKPIIGLVGFAKMFCDMRDFDDIFEIKLITSFVSSLDVIEEGVDRVISCGAELIIGGDIVCNHAKRHGIPCISQPHGRDSIEQAFRIADSVAWAADMEKKNAAELNVLLDFSSNGIIKVDKEGRIMSLNNRALSLLEKTREEVEGVNIRELIAKVEEQKIYDDVLLHGQEAFFTFWHSTGSALAVDVAPLMIDSAIEGAIFSLHVINKLKQMEEEARRDLYQNQKDSDYDWLPPLFSENLSFLRTAKNYAQYDECVLLSGSHPIEREMIARYMHDVSLRRGKPFVCLTGKAYSRDSLDNSQLLSNAGTIFIDKIEELSAQAQDDLFKLLSDGFLSRHINGELNIQIIVGTQASLYEAVREGTFREDLYYSTTALTLDVFSIENCPNEIKNWLNHYMQQYSDVYSTYIHITKGARNAILSHPWKGGLAELRGFCCKAMISTSKNVLDESATLRFLRRNNPYKPMEISQKSSGLNANPEVAMLKFLIEKHDGHRISIANEMNISVTTLWRRMKKYGFL